MANHWVAALGILVLCGTTVVLISSQRQREVVLSRLHFSTRRASGSKTPPRSFSPFSKSSMKERENEKSSTSSTPNFVDSFPPSRRCVLPELVEQAAKSGKTIVIGQEPSENFLRDNLLPTTQSYDLENDIFKYTPTGFSTAEIKSMGNFPAYDILSGVPLPAAYAGFDHNKALPRPYRPFRWAYHQTMSLTKLEPDWWLEVENTYKSRIVERRGLYEKYGPKVLDYLPGSELACKELMEISLQFYCARYPTLFSLSHDNAVFHNRILNEDTEIASMHPLHILLNNIPEDYAIVLRNETDGQYYFRAGVICSSLGWNVATKIGKNLREIHQPIPDYKEKMSFSMDRFFSKMETNKPIQRGSWGLEYGTPLFMPPGHPHEKLRDVQNEELKVEDCTLRVDWQTLRRLPLSAAIVFNFKALFTPATEFRDEPYVPALLLKILQEGKKTLMEYKGTWHVEHVCIPAFEKWEAEQREKGWVKAENEGEEKWNVCTLAEAPYFPGWEEKWHRQQGF